MNFLVRWWWLLLLGPVAGSIAATFAGERSDPFFLSETTVMVVGDPSGGASERLTNTYADLVELRPVLEEVIGVLGLDLTVEELGEKISATAALNRQLINIEAEDENPVMAAAIANTTASAFINHANGILAELTPPPSAEAGGVVPITEPNPSTLTVVEAAIPATEPSTPNVALNASIAAVLGLLVAASICIGLDSLQRDARPAGA